MQVAQTDFHVALVNIQNILSVAKKKKDREPYVNQIISIIRDKNLRQNITKQQVLEEETNLYSVTAGVKSILKGYSLTDEIILILTSLRGKSTQPSQEVEKNTVASSNLNAPDSKIQKGKHNKTIPATKEVKSVAPLESSASTPPSQPISTETKELVKTEEKEAKSQVPNHFARQENLSEFTLTMEKPEVLQAKNYKPIPVDPRNPRIYGAFERNVSMGEQVFWLYPFWECTAGSEFSLAYAFGLSINAFEQELKKIAVCKDVTNEQLEQFLKDNPNIQYLVVTGTKITHFPDIYHGLKMLCVNGCTSLKTLPEKFTELKTLHGSDCQFESIPSTYVNLEVVDCQNNNRLRVIPDLPKLKLMNCFASNSLNVSELKNLEAIICGDYLKKKMPNFIPFSYMAYLPPQAIQHMMYLHDGSSIAGRKNLYVNQKKSNNSLIRLEKIIQ